MSEKAPGFEDYTPSRLEWLVVILNSFAQHINSMHGDNVNYAYIPGEDGKTIILHIIHYDDLKPENVSNLEDVAKTFAIGIAKNYKWDSWIEIKTQWNPIERPTKH